MHPYLQAHICSWTASGLNPRPVMHELASSSRGSGKKSVTPKPLHPCAFPTGAPATLLRYFLAIQTIALNAPRFSGKRRSDSGQNPGI